MARRPGRRNPGVFRFILILILMMIEERTFHNIPTAGGGLPALPPVTGAFPIGAIWPDEVGFATL